MNVHQYLLGPMANFIYILEDDHTSKVAVVDPAWDVPFIIDELKNNQWELEKILLTHGHNDHVNGLDELLAYKEVPVYLSEDEAPFYTPNINLETVSDGDKVLVGGSELTVLSTPGHSPGCVCYCSANYLIAGDMIFMDGCGRVDLPGSDPESMYQSLRKVYQLEDSLMVWPGHDYGSVRSDRLGNLKKTNPYLAAVDKTDFFEKRGV